jgi:hypothetical protein
MIRGNLDPEGIEFFGIYIKTSADTAHGLKKYETHSPIHDLTRTKMSVVNGQSSGHEILTDFGDGYSEGFRKLPLDKNLLRRRKDKANASSPCCVLA